MLREELEAQRMQSGIHPEMCPTACIVFAQTTVGRSDVVTTPVFILNADFPDGQLQSTFTVKVVRVVLIKLFGADNGVIAVNSTHGLGSLRFRQGKRLGGRGVNRQPFGS